MAKNDEKLYQLKISLIGAKPPIWRRIVVPSSMDLSKLHDVIQITMGWTDCHLHQYVADDVFYGTPDPDWGDRTMSEKGVRIERLLKKPKDHIVYEYDFGDGWEHRIELEKAFPSDAKIVAPSCIGGRRSCPPEDVGGIWGYVSFLTAYKDPDHPQHEDMVEWVGEYFDPEKFDKDEINEVLATEYRGA